MNHRHCRYISCAVATLVLNDLNKLGLPVDLMYSLLEHLIRVKCCIFKYFRFILKLEKVHSPPGVQLEISSKYTVAISCGLRNENCYTTS